MAFTHVGHLITLAMRNLRLIPAGTFPSSEEYADYLDVFNVMRRQLSAKRYLTAAVADSLAIGAGVSSRTIGAAGQLVTERPIKITAAILRDTSSNDYRFPKIGNKLEYDSISNKTQTGKPCAIYYHSNYPLGVIYFDRVTDTAYTLLLESQKQMGDYADENTTLVDPPEAHEPLMYQLCIRIADQNSAALLTPTIAAKAAEGLRDLRRLRATETIEAINLPSGLTESLSYLGEVE